MVHQAQLRAKITEKGQEFSRPYQNMIVFYFMCTEQLTHVTYLASSKLPRRPFFITQCNSINNNNNNNWNNNNVTVFTT